MSLSNSLWNDKVCPGLDRVTRFGHFVPHCPTSFWLKTPADSGDRGLPRRHLESHGGRQSWFRFQYKSTTPKLSAILGHWPTNKRLIQIHFAPCLMALLCSNSLKGHFPSIPIWPRAPLKSSSPHSLTPVPNHSEELYSDGISYNTETFGCLVTTGGISPPQKRYERFIRFWALVLIKVHNYCK